MRDPCATCPHRTQPMPERDPVAELRQAALAAGYYVSPGDTVRTDCAAHLLGMAPQTLRADRCYWQRVPCRRVGGRVVYALRDLADYLAGGADGC